jgi:succinoglycan biosynthesis protein ExoM
MHHEICVCIATHRRPQQLERLLTSLTQQTGAPSFEVVVVDNDTKRSAEPVVTPFEDRLRVRYLVEPIRGLAQVRNRCVSASDSTFLAIIDDDHCASSDWLAALYRTAIESGAAAVMGRAIPEFESTVPESIRRCGLFEKKLTTMVRGFLGMIARRAIASCAAATFRTRSFLSTQSSI